MKHFSKV